MMEWPAWDAFQNSLPLAGTEDSTNTAIALVNAILTFIPATVFAAVITVVLVNIFRKREITK